jgi:outer membrane protein
MIRVTLLSVLVAAAATSAFAQAPIVAPPAPAPARDWSLTIGGSLGYVPKYEGSSDYEFRALPYVDANYKDVVFVRGLAAGVNLLNIKGPRAGDGLRMGPIVRYGFGREESDHEALRGLGDIDDAIEAGAFASYTAGPFLLDLQLVKDVGDGHDGVLADAGIAWRAAISPRMRSTFRASATWANDTYMQNVFGISPAQSARSGMRVHDAGAGFKDIGLSITLAYGLTEHWSVSGRVGYSRLLGDAADSPIVADRGAKNQVGTFLTVAYGF